MWGCQAGAPVTIWYILAHEANHLTGSSSWIWALTARMGGNAEHLSSPASDIRQLSSFLLDPDGLQIYNKVALALVFNYNDNIV